MLHSLATASPELNLDNPPSPQGTEVMHRSGRRPARVLRPTAHPPRVTYEGAVFKLKHGDQLIDVVMDSTGIHFRQPGGDSVAGHLDWDQALAMSLFPRGVREPAA